MKIRQLIMQLLIMFTLSANGQTEQKTDSLTLSKPIHLTLSKPIHQLRIYEIPKENRLAFHNRFRDHAIRIMKKYGFNIIAIWESEYKEKLEFVYLIEWENQDTMTTAWEKFRADNSMGKIQGRPGMERHKNGYK